MAQVREWEGDVTKKRRVSNVAGVIWAKERLWWWQCGVISGAVIVVITRKRMLGCLVSASHASRRFWMPAGRLRSLAAAPHLARQPLFTKITQSKTRAL